MHVGLALALLLGDPGQPAPEQPAPEQAGPEIVVTATTPRKCKVELEDRTLSNRQLEANARAWAASGVPVRVVTPRGAHYRCLAKVAFSLERHGVRLIQFVDRTR